MQAAALIFAALLAAAPILAATVLAHRMGRRGAWKIWPTALAVLFALAMELGYAPTGEGGNAFLSILAGGYVGCLALLLSLVAVRAAPQKADATDVL